MPISYFKIVTWFLFYLNFSLEIAPILVQAAVGNGQLISQIFGANNEIFHLHRIACENFTEFCTFSAFTEYSVNI